MRYRHLLTFSICLVWVFLPSNAFSKSYQGETLEEPISVKFVLSDDQVAIAKSSQRTSDISIELYDSKLDKLIRVSNVDPYMMLNELMFVEADDCRECEIRLVAKEYVAQRSPFEMEVEITDRISISEPVIAIFRSLSFALDSFHQSKELIGEQKGLKLIEGIAELEKYEGIPQNDSSLEIWLHSQVVLAEIFSSAGRDLDQIKTLKRLKNASKSKKPIYSIIASYQLAASTQNEVETNNHYVDGIRLSKDIADPMYVAIGESYQGVHLVRIGKITKGTKYFAAALDRFVSEKSWHFVLPLLHNMSWAKSRAGDMATALEFATQAKLVAQQFKEEVYVLWALYSMGIAYGELGHSYQAGALFEEAIAHHAKLPLGTESAAALLIGYLHQDKARVLMYQGAYDLAWDASNTALMHYRNGGYDSSEIDALFIQGEIAIARGDLEIAHDRLSQVISYDEKNSRSRHLARHLLKLSELQCEQGKYLAASLSINEAVKIVSQTEDFITLGETYSQIVNVLYYLGAYEDALDLAKRFEPYLTKYNSEHDKAIFYYRKARNAYAAGNALVTQSSLDKAIEIVDRTLPKVVRKDLVRSYLALQKSLFELNLEFFLDLNPQALREAITIVERHRARTLQTSIKRLKMNDSLNNEQAKTRRNILEEIHESAMTWYSRETRRDSDLLEKARALSARMGSFEAGVILANQESAESSSEIDQIGWHAKSNETILYYFVGQKKTWLWVINQGKISLHNLPGNDELGGMVSAVLDQISTHPAERDNVTAWELRRSLEKLGEQLLMGVLENGELHSNNSIVVIADGPLHGFPFGVLPNSDPSRSHMLDEWPIEYAPSLQTRELFSLAGGESTEKFETAIVITNPRFRGGNTPLKESSRDSDMLKRHLGIRAIAIDGDRAQKHIVLEQLKKTTSILHIATHGLVNSQEPALSGLLFSGDQGDQMWLAPEISSSSVNADLVVLSACESASGRYVAGEGLMSLSRAFFEAGASKVIGSLWKIQDDVSADLTGYFYQNLLGEKMSVSDALRRAKIKVRDDKSVDRSDPYFWSAFQYQGATGRG